MADPLPHPRVTIHAAVRHPQDQLRPWEAAQRDRGSRRTVVVELLDDPPGPTRVGQPRIGLPANDPSLVLIQGGRQSYVRRNRLVEPAHAVQEDEQLHGNAERLQPPGEPDCGAAAQALSVDHPARPLQLGGGQFAVLVGVERVQGERPSHVEAPVLERLGVPPDGGFPQREGQAARFLKPIVPSVQPSHEPDRHAGPRRDRDRGRQIVDLHRGAADREQGGHGCGGGEPNACHREPR